MVAENIILGNDLSKRKYGLDILRALAIVFVLIHHTDFTFSPFIDKIAKFISLDGVSIFFVLSGYLIGGILLKTINNKDFKLKELFRFWINRWMRTLPPYYFVLILLFILSKNFNLLVQSYFLSFKDKISYFLFLQNFKTPHLGFFAESWSLSIEEWFYLIIPIMLFFSFLLFKTKPKSTILFTIITIILCITLYRLNSYMIDFSSNLSFEQYDLWFRKLAITRLDSIVFGVFGAYIVFYYQSFWKRHLKTSFVIGLIIIIIDHAINMLLHNGVLLYRGWSGLYGCVFSFSIMSIGVLLLLPYLSQLPQSKGRIYKSITFISLISYSLYLLHFSFIYFCIMLGIPFFKELPPFVFVLVYWSLCLILSTIMYKYIEKPFMDSRKAILKKLKL